MAITTYQATVTSTDTPNIYQAQVRDFTINFDLTGRDNGYELGMKPEEAILASLGACESIVAGTFKRKRHFDLQSFWVDIEGDLGREDVADGDNRYKFTEIRYQPHLRSSESDEDIKQFLADVARKCPVENTLAFGTKFVADGFVKE